MTMTGRSPTSPHVQNIPIHTDLGRQIKEAFRRAMKTQRVDLGPGLALETVAIQLVTMARRSGDTYRAIYWSVPLVVTPTTEVSEVIKYVNEAFAPEAENRVPHAEPV